MVKITLEFANVDEAIVALGKLTKAAGTTIVDGKPRKGRNDKGQARGPHKPATSEAAAPAEQERTDKAATLPPKAAPAEADKAHPSGEVPPVAAASSIPTDADAQKVLEKLFETPPPIGGLEQARAVMGRFGVKRLRDLKEEQRADFIKLAESVLAGGKA